MLNTQRSKTIRPGLFFAMPGNIVNLGSSDVYEVLPAFSLQDVTPFVAKITGIREKLALTTLDDPLQ